MKKLFYGIRVSLITALLMLFVMGAYTYFYNETVETRLKIGGEGERVVKVQEKLKELGLYDGKCDGIYDVETADAVRRFQEYNGLVADGICKNDTLNALGLYIYTYSEFEIDVLARLIEAESNGGDLQTMTAVGAVIINRVRSKSFPDSVLQVIYSGGSFNSVKNGKLSEVNASELAYRAASDAMMGYDPTDGALYVFHGHGGGKIVTLKCGDLYFAK